MNAGWPPEYQGASAVLYEMSQQDPTKGLAAETLLRSFRSLGNGVEQVEAGHGARLKEGGAFVFDEPDDIPAIWGSGERVLWAEGEGCLIYSDQGLGKTTLAQRLVLHLVGIETGVLLGFPVRQLPPEKKVFYLAMDRPRQAARSLRRMVGAEHRGDLDKYVTVWKGPLPVNPLREASTMADWAQEVCPEVGVIVIDSVKDLAPGVSGDEVGAGLNSAWQELIARGVDLVSLHHGRKSKQGDSRRMSLDEVYGSVWLTSGQGSVIGLDGEQGRDIVEMFHLKQPAETVGPLTLRFNRAAGSVDVIETARSLQAFMVQAGDIGVTIKDASRVVYGDDQTKNQQRISRMFKRLIERDLVVKMPGDATSGGRAGDSFVLSEQVRWAVEQGQTKVEDIFEEDGA